MNRVIKTVAAAGLTALTIGTALDLTTSSAEARYYRGGYRHGFYGRRGVGLGLGLAAGALAAGAAATAAGAYYGAPYGYGYYGRPYVGYPGYGYYGYGY